MVPGDELRLRYPGDSTHSAWQSVGHVVHSPLPEPFHFVASAERRRRMSDNDYFHTVAGSE